MTQRSSLGARIAAKLREQIANGEYQVGSRLPTEAVLATSFSVSRPTIRAALQELEVLGLIRTQHGVGSIVIGHQSTRSGLHPMESITDSIRAMGMEPSTVYASRLIRHVLPEESMRMEVPGDAQVVELRRTILADGEVVAYSYDLVPCAILPPDFSPEHFTGSVFAYFRDHTDVLPDHGTAEVHAVHSEHIGWGAEAAAHKLFILLNQLHYSADDTLLTDILHRGPI